MVIRHRDMLKTESLGLARQLNRQKTAVTALGMAVKIETSRTTFSVNGGQNFSKRVLVSRHGPPRHSPIPGAVVSSGHRTESRRP